MSESLQVIADQLAIRTVLHRYCRYLDLRRPDVVAQEVYTADAVDDRGREHVPTGHAEIEAMFRSALESLEATAHVLGSISVDVDGDGATSEAYVTAWHWMARPDASPLTRPADFALVAVYSTSSCAHPSAGECAIDASGWPDQEASRSASCLNGSVDSAV